MSTRFSCWLQPLCRTWPLYAYTLAAVMLLLAAVFKPANSAGDSAVAEYGQQRFLECCSACHNSLRKVGPPLAEDTAYFIKAGVPAEVMGVLLQHAVRQRPPDSRMPVFTPEEVSDADLHAMGMFLASCTPPPAEPPQLGSAERGAELYARHCAMCHGAKGEGVGQMLPLALFAEELRSSGAPPNLMLGFVTLSTRSGDVPKMPVYSPEQLSDADLADLAAYLWAMPPLAPPSTN